MVESKRDMAPGCFASAVAFAMDSNTCQQCVAFSECGVESEKTLQAICTKINVKDILARHERSKRAYFSDKPRPLQKKLDSEVSPLPVSQPKQITKEVERKTGVEVVNFVVSFNQQAIIDTMTNNNAKALAATLIKKNRLSQIYRNLAVGLSMKEKEVPKYLIVVLDHLLAGGFTKAQCKDNLMEALTWKAESAAPHVALICVFLLAFDIAAETNGVFTLHPNIICNNHISQ